MSNRGIGLISILIAIVLIGVGAVGILSLSAKSGHLIATSTHRVSADAVASQVMEQVLAMDTVPPSFSRSVDRFVVNGQVITYADSINILRVYVSVVGKDRPLTRISRPIMQEIN